MKELADCLYIDSALKIDASFTETSVRNLLDYRATRPGGCELDVFTAMGISCFVMAHV
jgi:hypothetical protein